MASSNIVSLISESANSILRGLHYAFYDWTREMPKARRILVWAGILIQGYAIYAGFSRSLIWPLIWPTGPSLIVSLWLMYVLGGTVINAMLTGELKRKTQLEADQIAARQIHQTRPLCDGGVSDPEPRVRRTHLCECRS